MVRFSCLRIHRIDAVWSRGLIVLGHIEVYAVIIESGRIGPIATYQGGDDVDNDDDDYTSACVTICHYISTQADACTQIHAPHYVCKIMHTRTLERAHWHVREHEHALSMDTRARALDIYTKKYQRICIIVLC